MGEIYIANRPKKCNDTLEDYQFSLRLQQEQNKEFESMETEKKRKEARSGCDSLEENPNKRKKYEETCSKDSSELEMVLKNLDTSNPEEKITYAEKEDNEFWLGMQLERQLEIERQIAQKRFQEASDLEFAKNLGEFNQRSDSKILDSDDSS